MNKAIDVICPFVSDEVKLEEDPRHTCDKTAGEQKAVGKANFLWAFAHLSEAIAFDKVVNYKTTQAEETNLELRMAAIEGREVNTPSEISAFIDEVDSLNEAIGKILPTDGVCSSSDPQTQFDALLNDLVATTVAFGAVPGIPEDITKSLEESMSGILATREEAGDGVESDTDGAFKGDLTADISESLAEKIDDVNSTSGMSQSELEEVCASYDSISGGNPEGRPAACAGISLRN